MRLRQCGLTLIESACASTSCHCSQLSSVAIYRLTLLHFHIISSIILTPRQETSHIALDTIVTASQLWIPNLANSPHFDRPSSPGCPSKGLGYPTYLDLNISNLCDTASLSFHLFLLIVSCAATPFIATADVLELTQDCSLAKLSSESMSRVADKFRAESHSTRAVIAPVNVLIQPEFLETARSLCHIDSESSQQYHTHTSSHTRPAHQNHLLLE